MIRIKRRAPGRYEVVNTFPMAFRREDINFIYAEGQLFDGDDALWPVGEWTLRADGDWEIVLYCDRVGAPNHLAIWSE